MALAGPLESRKAGRVTLKSAAHSTMGGRSVSAGGALHRVETMPEAPNALAAPTKHFVLPRKSATAYLQEQCQGKRSQQYHSRRVQIVFLASNLCISASATTP